MVLPSPPAPPAAGHHRAQLHTSAALHPPAPAAPNPAACYHRTSPSRRSSPLLVRGERKEEGRGIHGGRSSRSADRGRRYRRRGETAESPPPRLRAPVGRASAAASPSSRWMRSPHCALGIPPVKR
ncbi:unnamed protein product [Urochloa humidicola]